MILLLEHGGYNRGIKGTITEQEVKRNEKTLSSHVYFDVILSDVSRMFQRETGG